MFLSTLKLRNKVAFLAGGILSISLCSCDSSFVYEDLRPCIPVYKVKLSYDHNMAYAERVSQVEAAEIYAFDSEGNLATIAKADKQTLIDNDWTMDLNVERFQPYDLVIWGGLTGESPFALDGTRAVTSKEDLTCRLTTETDENGNESSKKVFPPLFHGTASVTYSVEDGPEIRVAPLKKNTNTLDLIIRKKTGDPVEEGYYTIKLTDSNGVMDHTNAVSGSLIHYYPVSFTSTQQKEPNGEGGEGEVTSEAGIAKYHLSRLMNDSEARLTITIASSGMQVFDKKLIDIFKEAKEKEAPNMDTQEYLDRQDTYTLDLTLPVDEDWSAIQIYINNWRVVYNDLGWK